MTTHGQRTNHLGDLPLVILEVRYGNGKIGVIGEGAKGPVRAIVERVVEVHSLPLSFKSGGGDEDSL